MHPLPLARYFALEQSDEKPLREHEARGEIGNRDAHPHGAIPRLSGDGHETAQPLGYLVQPRPRAVGALLPEAGDAPVDDARVDRATGLVIHPQAVLHVGPVVFDDDVGALAPCGRISRGPFPPAG